MKVNGNQWQQSNAFAACRSLIPALQNKSYFNFGGQGTLPQPALDAIFDAYQFVQRQGPFSTAMFEWLNRELAESRTVLAGLLGGDPSSYVLTQNVSEGCNIAVWGQNWQADDIILTTDCEHESLVNILETLSRRYGVKVEYLEVTGLSSAQVIENVRRALKPRTRLFAFSHVLWNTGAVLPAREMIELCSENNTRTLVDGAQSVGALVLNLPALQADYYAFTGHKWLCGPEGVGGLYIAPSRLSDLQPTFVGWRSTEMVPPGSIADAARFEVATTAFPLLAGLRTAIEFHNRWGTRSEREDQILQNSNFFHQLLNSEGTTKGSIKPLSDALPRAGLVSFSIEGVNNSAVVAQCEKAGYLMRTIPKPRCIRASLHYFTSTEEIEALVSMVHTASMVPS